MKAEDATDKILELINKSPYHYFDGDSHEAKQIDEIIKSLSTPTDVTVKESITDNLKSQTETSRVKELEGFLRVIKVQCKEHSKFGHIALKNLSKEIESLLTKEA